MGNVWGVQPGSQGLRDRVWGSILRNDQVKWEEQSALLSITHPHEKGQQEATLLKLKNHSGAQKQSYPNVPLHEGVSTPSWGPLRPPSSHCPRGFLCHPLDKLCPLAAGPAGSPPGHRPSLAHAWLGARCLRNAAGAAPHLSPASARVPHTGAGTCRSSTSWPRCSLGRADTKGTR